MSESRELDVQVATIVMGHDVVGSAYVSWWDGPSVRFEQNDEYDTFEPVYVDTCRCANIEKLHEQYHDEYWSMRLHGHHPHCLGVLPNYSTRMDHVWLVVQKLQSLGHHISIESYRNKAGAMAWSVYWTFGDENWTPGIGSTAAEAICRASIATIKDANPSPSNGF